MYLDLSWEMDGTAAVLDTMAYMRITMENI